MMRILKKNARFFLQFSFMAACLMLLLRILTGVPLKPGMVIISGILMYPVIIGSIFVSEQYEEKHNGYVFLDSLPVTPGEIVGAKFAFVFINIAVFVLFLLVLFWVAWGVLSPRAFSFVLLNSVVCLILAGLTYIGILGLNYTIFLKVSLFILVLLQIVPLLLLRGGKVDVYVAGFKNFLTSLNWLFVIPVVLAVYLGMLYIAVKVKS